MRGADSNRLVGPERRATSLMEAASDGHSACMKLLARYGADVNLRDAKGCTALMKAAEFGQTQAAKWLLAQGARLDTADGAA